MAQRGRGETPQSSSSSASSSTPSPSLMLSSSSSPLSSICCEHHHHHQTQQKYLHHHDQNHRQDKQHQHFELGNHPYFTFIIMVNPGLVRKGTLHTAQLFVAYSKALSGHTDSSYSLQSRVLAGCQRRNQQVNTLCKTQSPLVQFHYHGKSLSKGTLNSCLLHILSLWTYTCILQPPI